MSCLLHLKKKQGMVTPYKLPLVPRSAQEHDPFLARTLPRTILAKMPMVLVVFFKPPLVLGSDLLVFKKKEKMATPYIPWLILAPPRT